MSPLTLRRYRAERMLRQDFDGLRDATIAIVRGRLRASGVSLDASDLDACYAQAWQGLYTAMLGGETIANPRGWLALVTFRRALDEHRTHPRDHADARVTRDDVEHCRGDDAHRDARTRARARDVPAERDITDELDDRRRLRQLFEGLRGRLTTRECQAAALCYLQGLSRAEAAERMGIGQARMRKLMEGPGAGRPGVAGKVGELLDTINGGGWCEEQSSTMRGLAFGILDPDGERYQLALAHQRECPACRRYVLCLRGLAAALPPIALPWTLVGASAGGAAAGASTGVGAGAQAVGGGASAGAGTGGLSVSGAAGIGGAAGGAAGGGWLLAGGSVGAKLAVGCLLALSVSCVALTGPLSLKPHPAREPHHLHVHGGLLATSARAPSAGDAATAPLSAAVTPDALAGRSPQPIASAASAPAATLAARAAREFGPERTLAPRGALAVAATAQRGSVAREASSGSPLPPSIRPASAAAPSQSPPSGGSSSSGGSSGGTSSSGGSSGGRSAAAREFGVG